MTAMFHVDHSRPLAIDLFTGLHGWAEGLISEGWRVLGFDLYDMCALFGIERPAHVQLVVQDVITLCGAQFRDADLIVASPPCQEYSYRAMPWKRAKALPPPSNDLFDACFRIQREACAAKGAHVPLIVENVCGAQKFVGRARAHYGSFYLWGDVPALMPKPVKAAKVGGLDWSKHDRPDYKTNGAGCFRDTGGIKNTGGSWFNVAHNTTSGKGRNPDGRTRNADPMSRTRGLRRRLASATIAKIPLELASYIGRVFKPQATLQAGAA